MSHTPTLSEVIQAHIDERLNQLYTSEPGSITSYDKFEGVADIKPMLRTVYKDEEGNLVSKPKPILRKILVLLPGGRMNFTLKPGTPGMLLFSSGCIDGYAPKNIEPALTPFNHRHSLGNAVFIPAFPQTRFESSEAPGDDEVVMNWQSVLLGTGAIRSPVARKADLSAIASKLAELAAPLHSSDPSAGAALDAVVTAINYAIGLMSENVWAT